MKHVAILLANGFEEVEALLPADFMRRAGLDVVLVSISDEEMIQGSHNICVKTDTKLHEIQQQRFDAVLAPGGLPGSEYLGNNTHVVAFLRAQQQQGAIIAAICAAPALVFAKNGFLKDCDYTCNPGFFDEAETMLGRTASKNRVVVAGQVVTSQAAGTTAELTHTLICMLLGKDHADKIMHGALFKLN